MTAIEFEHVSKSFRVERPWGLKDALLGSGRRRHKPRVVQALDDVTFTVAAGESTALLGHNGAGKSTALKLLAGTLMPTSGSVRTFGRIAPLLELGAGFHPDLTARENVFLNAAILGVPRARVRSRLDSIVDFAGVEDFLDTPVRFYSSGMTARLGFAIAIHVEPEIILIDEVLAVGDAEFQAKCVEQMKSLRDEGRTLMLVTHSLAQAQDFCSRAVVLDHGQVTYDGPVESLGALPRL